MLALALTAATAEMLAVAVAWMATGGLAEEVAALVAVAMVGAEQAEEMGMALAMATEAAEAAQAQAKKGTAAPSRRDVNCMHIPHQHTTGGITRDPSLSKLPASLHTSST